MPSDDELIAAAQKGDVSAFEELVCRYDDKVLGVALSYMNNMEDAKDIYQEVFIRVHRALPNFKFRSKFSTWLYRIVVNVCLTQHAKARRHPHVSLDQEIEAGQNGSLSLMDRLACEETSEDLAMTSELGAQLQGALSALSPRQKLVFTLRHYHGYKLREIAGMLRCAEGTVKRHLFTATERMQKQLRAVYQ